MNKIFIDTNGWIALNSKRDNLYSKALTLNRELLQKGFEYVTTNFILDETYTWLAIKAAHSMAVDLGEKIRCSKKIRVVHITEEVEEEAWQLFKQYRDKNFSFTDCTSFAVMRKLGITKAFTNDRHFRQMEFEAVLQEQ